MQVWCEWQVTLCDPHLSALEARFSRRRAIQIDVYLYHGLAALAGVWLRAMETEISAALWTLVARKGLQLSS